MREIYRRDKILVLYSGASGLISFPISLGVSTYSHSHSIFSSPYSNAAVGAITAWLVYLSAFGFFLVNRERLRALAKGIPLDWSRVSRVIQRMVPGMSVKEAAEQGIRFILHSLLLVEGFSVPVSSGAAQIIAGAFGHLSAPLFANLVIPWIRRPNLDQ